MKRFLSLLLVAALCLSLTSAALADGTVEIDFWCQWGAEEFYNEVAEKFMAENPGVKVNVLQIPFWDYGTKLDPSLVTGVAADVFTYSSNSTHAAQGYTAAIDDYLKASKYYDPSAISQAAVEGFMYDGKTYGLPLTVNTQLLAYNKDLFAAAGLDPECPPKTWEEVLEYARKITKIGEDGSIEILGFHPLYDAGLSAQKYLKLFGVDCLDGEKCAFNTEAGIYCFKTLLAFNEVASYEQMTAYQEIANAEYATTNINYFEAGKVGMIMCGDDQNGLLMNKGLSLNIGVTQLPTGGDNTQRVALGSSFGFEFTWHGSEERLQAAVDFAAFVLNEENSLKYAQIYANQMSNNAARAAYNSSVPAVCDNYWDVVEAAAATNVTIPNCLAYPSYDAVLTDELRAMFRGEKTAEQALADAEYKITLEIENYHIFND